MENNSTISSGVRGLSFSKKSPQPWDFLYQYMQGQKINLLIPIAVIVIAILIAVAIGPFVMSLAAFFIFRNTTTNIKPQKKKIVKHYSESSYFFIDFSILRFLASLSVLEKDTVTMLKDIETNIRKKSPEEFLRYLEELYNTEIEGQGFRKKETQMHAYKEELQEKYTLPSTQLEDSFKKDTDVSSQTPSIWDNYESVIDTMNKNK